MVQINGVQLIKEPTFRRYATSVIEPGDPIEVINLRVACPDRLNSRRVHLAHGHPGWRGSDKLEEAITAAGLNDDDDRVAHRRSYALIFQRAYSSSMRGEIIRAWEASSSALWVLPNLRSMTARR